jgi:hypothetical protein
VPNAHQQRLQRCYRGVHQFKEHVKDEAVFSSRGQFHRRGCPRTTIANTSDNNRQSLVQGCPTTTHATNSNDYSERATSSATPGPWPTRVPCAPKESAAPQWSAHNAICGYTSAAPALSHTRPGLKRGNVTTAWIPPISLSEGRADHLLPLSRLQPQQSPLLEGPRTTHHLGPPRATDPSKQDPTLANGRGEKKISEYCN